MPGPQGLLFLPGFLLAPGELMSPRRGSIAAPQLSAQDKSRGAAGGAGEHWGGRGRLWAAAPPAVMARGGVRGPAWGCSLQCLLPPPLLLPASGGSCGVSSLSAAPGAAAFLLAALKERLLRSCGPCKWGGPCGSGVGWGGCFCLGWGCSSLWAVATAAGAVSATGCCLWVKWDGGAVGWSGGVPRILWGCG